uniref:Carboxylic ester hydrolase n=1 Tax=Helicoverpa armigera TaxID=29058 RepID=D5G3E0_HELAM|nr:carboxyl/choline esterase CCE006a [Helicoverpa armigera]
MNIMGDKIIFVLPLIFCLIHNGSGLSRIDPLVDSKVGLIRGLRATDGDYSMFMGIPYATVNESNPFGPSTPHPGFDDVFEAYDDSAICPQIEEFHNTVVGSVDCLHLNIYAPNSANSRNRLPVLVWIYGGGFSIGFSGRFLYGPQFFVEKEVILVTLNYRLGPYGFMCLDIPDVPGNQGLKDQQLALKWIKDNIEAFGGDSNQITIMGESAGGASVDFHLLYSQEKLFDKVILQSGAALSPWAIAEPDTSAPLKLSEHLGFATKDIQEALDFLATVDTNLIIASIPELGLEFRPCKENDFENVEKFIHDYPLNIKKPSIANVPILTGYNTYESLYIYDKLSEEEFENLNVFHDFLVKYFNLDDEDLFEMEQYVRNFYIGDEKISKAEEDGIIKFHSDLFFTYPVVRTIQKYLDNGVKNIYFYLFSYEGERNFVKNKQNITTAGASHADELGYLFDISYMGEPNPEDQLIVDRITTLWSNFVKYGNPTPETSELLPVQWPIVTKDLLNYLNIDSELQVEKRNFNTRIVFWELFYKLNEKAQIGYKEDSE